MFSVLYSFACDSIIRICHMKESVFEFFAWLLLHLLACVLVEFPFKETMRTREVVCNLSEPSTTALPSFEQENSVTQIFYFAGFYCDGFYNA